MKRIDEQTSGPLAAASGPLAKSTGLLAATEGALARTGNLSRWRRSVLGEPSYAQPGQSPAAQPVPDGPLDRVRMNALETPEQPVPLRGITHWPLAELSAPTSAAALDFEWRCAIGADGVSVTLTPGTVWCAPNQEIAWSSITGYSETLASPTLVDGDTAIWVEVTLAGLGACTAALFVGTAAELSAALDATEQENKIVRPIASLTWASSKITASVQRQMGAICVSR